jgi:hypothetical protein
MVTVINLMNPEHKQIYSCTPKEAVIAAYAQSLNDWNTWQYAERYSNLVEEGELTWMCGDFSAFKDGRTF